MELELIGLRLKGMEEKKRSGPGKSFRKGITLMEAVQRFGDDAKAHEWFVKRRWPNGVQCPDCDSHRVSPRKKKRKTPLYHCNACKFDFTVKTGTIMHDSKLPLSTWALAFYLVTTNIKGISSMKLHRDLGITQKTAWHLAHRIRETYNEEMEKFGGPVEADETYVGGQNKNRHRSKRVTGRGRGTVGKAVVAGLRDRETNQVLTQVVDAASRPILKEFVEGHTRDDALIYTDEWAGYGSLNRRRESVSHSAGEYVRGMASTNSLESHWALFKRGLDGTYHHISFKHLHRYTTEFEGRHNRRPLDTEDQLAAMVFGAEGKHLPYSELIA